MLGLKITKSISRITFSLNCASDLFERIGRVGVDQRFDNYEGGGKFCFFLKGLEVGRRGMLYLNFFLSKFVNLKYRVNQGSSTQVPLLHCSVLCLSLRIKIVFH